MTAHEFRLQQATMMPTRGGKWKDEPEAALQAACVGWFRMTYRHLAHALVYVPNEHAYPRIRAAENPRRKKDWVNPKDMGLVAGVSDLVLLLPRGNFGGLCLEMKTKQGTLSDRQIAWGVQMLESGYLWQCVRTEERFREVVRGYLGL